MPGTAGEAEVGHLDRALVGNEHVRRLEVAMDDPGRVRRRQPAPRLDELRHDLRRWRVGLEPGLQGRARHILHRDDQLVVVQRDVVHRHDVGMAELRHRLRFADETGAVGSLGPGVQPLEGYVAPELGVPGPVDAPHAALPDQLDHLVAAHSDAGPDAIAEEAGGHLVPRTADLLLRRGHGSSDPTALVRSGLVRTDEELLAAWGDGDDAAGRALFDRYFEPLYRFFCNKVDDGVEDLIQETFLASVEARSRFRGDASVRTFLFAIARKRLYKRWRRAHRDAVIDFGVTSMLGSRAVAQSRGGRPRGRPPAAGRSAPDPLRPPGRSRALLLGGHVGHRDRSCARHPRRHRRAAGCGGRRNTWSRSCARGKGEGGSPPADDDLERWAAEIRAQLSLEASSASSG